MNYFIVVFMIFTFIEGIFMENEPIEQYVAQGINTRVDNAANSITNFRNGVSEFGQAAHDKFVGAAQAVGQFFQENGFENMKDGAEQWFGNAGNHVKNLWNDAGNTASNIGSGVRQGVQYTGQAISNGFHYIYDGAGNIIGTAENAVGRKLENAGNALQNH